MIPLTPSASYLADGFVIISISWIEFAGINFKASVTSKFVGLLSINNVKLEFPLKLTFPSISTLIDGTFSNTSTADSEAVVFRLLTSITFLSISYLTNGLSLVISTSSNWLSIDDKRILPKSILLFCGCIFTESIIFVAYPINENRT